jgi:hypothetical protein
MMIERVTYIYLSIFALLNLLLLPVEVIANEEFAKLPYDRLLQIQDTILKNLPSGQPFFMHIFSSNPQVKNSDISLHLVSANEKIEIPLDKRGFIELPIRRDLVGQGAYIVSNQPKGTMVLRGESRSDVPLKSRKIDYKELISPVIAANSVSQIAKEIPEITSARYINSINLFVDQDGNAPVIIRPKGGKEIQIFPDKFGNVLIPIEEELQLKNPIVEFPSDDVFVINSWE